MTSEFREQRALLFALDAFGDDGEVQLVPEADDHFGDAGAVSTVADVVDERAVDLQAVDRQAVKIRERGEAGAEVVDGNGDAQRLQGVQLGFYIGSVGHRHRLGNL